MESAQITGQRPPGQKKPHLESLTHDRLAPLRWNSWTGSVPRGGGWGHLSSHRNELWEPPTSSFPRGLMENLPFSGFHYHSEKTQQDSGFSVLFLFFFFVFCLFRAAPVAYGDSQAKGLIRVTAANVHHSHSNGGSEPHL